MQRFHKWFRDEAGKLRQNVADPEIIQFCHRNGWMLVTRDHEMKNLHRQEILRTEIAILATAHNTNENQDEWVIALINLKSRILREFKEARTPMVCHFQSNSSSEYKYC